MLTVSSLPPCQDKVEVEVVQLTAVRIRAPITRMKVGTQVSWFGIGFCHLHVLELQVVAIPDTSSGDSTAALGGTIFFIRDPIS